MPTTDLPVVCAGRCDVVIESGRSFFKAEIGT